MPRLKQVTRADATDNVRRYYEQLFGDRDPVDKPGTATGTPGNWWTVFALKGFVFDHATGLFAAAGDKNASTLDATLRELALMRVGFTQASRFVYSQHCKAARRFKIGEDKIAAIPSWSVSDAFSAKERAVLAYVDGLILEGGRVPDATFAALKSHLADEDILELTYHALTYNLHAIMCKALRLEYDDVDERVTEIPIPKNGGVAEWR
jgi:alkylhydroperoxidase family enzyme